MPPIWSRANPVDIAGDADAARYAAALEQLLADEANDAVLVMNVPTALGAPLDAANAVIAVTQKLRSARFPPKPVLAVWLGDGGLAEAAFDAAHIPSYATEADAVGGFMHLVAYRQSRELLLAAPPNLAADFAPDAAAV